MCVRVCVRACILLRAGPGVSALCHSWLVCSCWESGTSSRTKSRCSVGGVVVVAAPSHGHAAVLMERIREVVRHLGTSPDMAGHPT